MSLGNVIIPIVSPPVKQVSIWETYHAGQPVLTGLWPGPVWCPLGNTQMWCTVPWEDGCGCDNITNDQGLTDNWCTVLMEDCQLSDFLWWKINGNFFLFNTCSYCYYIICYLIHRVVIFFFFPIVRGAAELAPWRQLSTLNSPDIRIYHVFGLMFTFLTILNA